MDMRHLRCFVAVVEEMHFGRAAERLHLTQPPVSLAIKELEEELGVTLLERTSRRIVLTKAGEDALRDARAVLAAADTMRRRARETSQGSWAPCPSGSSACRPTPPAGNAEALWRGLSAGPAIAAGGHDRPDCT